ncbi:unnamed protein product [Spodoptera littoralis]|uniref:Uncharacterized protein n=1 Tax=Spodoptera littoralis TaxID=7109 RepID=A0A9P0HWE1_SPOLI|nr:unnamed protein product [Spodoptera littoralis]CAH1635050.1 unnamed protein product [Spodoptera littoralis]
MSIKRALPKQLLKIKNYVGLLVRLNYFYKKSAIPYLYLFYFKKTSHDPNLTKMMTQWDKSKGQTFSLVGIDLRKECFSHGQLYVGLSRVGSSENQIILLPENKTTSNIVYREALN